MRYNSGGNSSIFKPMISVWYSTKYFELIKGYEKDSLYPDIYVEQNFENYLNGIDSKVEMVLEIED